MLKKNTLVAICCIIDGWFKVDFGALFENNVVQLGLLLEPLAWAPSAENVHFQYGASNANETKPEEYSKPESVVSKTHKCV